MRASLSAVTNTKKSIVSAGSFIIFLVFMVKRKVLVKCFFSHKLSVMHLRRQAKSFVPFFANNRPYHLFVKFRSRPMKWAVAFLFPRQWATLKDDHGQERLTAAFDFTVVTGIVFLGCSFETVLGMGAQVLTGRKSSSNSLLDFSDQPPPAPRAACMYVRQTSCAHRTSPTVLIGG